MRSDCSLFKIPRVAVFILESEMSSRFCSYTDRECSCPFLLFQRRALKMLLY